MFLHHYDYYYYVWFFYLNSYYNFLKLTFWIIGSHIKYISILGLLNRLL